jgi:phosphoglycolate phosphatase-like HAD superfamily hydrolase
MKNHPPRLPEYPWLEIAHPSVRLGRVRYALFDFDGTLSVIRHGWEQIMIAVMLEGICNSQSPDPQIVDEVSQYVDKSTGILTIKQMKWLEEAVRLYGISEIQRSASEYKRIYNDRLLQPVLQRLALLDGSLETRDAWMVAGARDFLHRLAQRGVKLFMASGTDQEYVVQEAGALGIRDYFGDHIYGAKGDSELDSKELVIQRILDEQDLQGEELLVVGDGPVEIQSARQRGAVALGIAANELDRTGLDPRKRQRLLDAGANFIIANFLHSAELVEILCLPVRNE